MSRERPSFETWRYGPKFVASENSPMLSHMKDIPALPVPELESTITRALQSCHPLAQDEAEFEALKKKSIDFLATAGPKLQGKLQEKASRSKNWLAKDWDMLAYFTYRDPVVLNVSYYYGFSKLPQGPPGSKPAKDDPAFVAASILAYACNFREELIRGEMKPDEAGGVKQDVTHYNWMFNACRIPHGESDYAVKIPESDPKGDHVIVVRRNHHYKLPVKDQTGQRYSIDSLRQSIQKIYDETPEKAAIPVGVLTATDRDLWTKARNHLVDSSEKNVEALRAIEQAIAVVCLDEHKPTTTDGKSSSMAEFSKLLWYGNANDRWWDKPIQWVVFDSGESGILGEHSCMDGTPTARLNNEMTLALMAGKLPEIENASEEVSSPQSLSFELDEEAKSLIKQAADNHAQATGKSQLYYLNYDRYGKEEIKKHKVSPDSWVQMVMQLAYALTNNGKVTATYESASVRRFALGRTETVRVCSDASKAFVNAMLDQGTSNSQRVDLFRAAVAQHGRDMKSASSAQGIDRHLLGLKLGVAADEPTPEFLKDPLLARSGRWVMSTSQVYGRYFPAYGWGAVVPDGYGIPYMIQANSLLFTITAITPEVQCKELADNIKIAADTLLDLVANNQSPHLHAKL